MSVFFDVFGAEMERARDMISAPKILTLLTAIL